MEETCTDASVRQQNSSSPLLFPVRATSWTSSSSASAAVRPLTDAGPKMSCSGTKGLGSMAATPVIILDDDDDDEVCDEGLEPSTAPLPSSSWSCTAATTIATTTTSTRHGGTPSSMCSSPPPLLPSPAAAASSSPRPMVAPQTTQSPSPAPYDPPRSRPVLPTSSTHQTPLLSPPSPPPPPPPPPAETPLRSDQYHEQLFTHIWTLLTEFQRSVALFGPPGSGRSTWICTELRRRVAERQQTTAASSLSSATGSTPPVQSPPSMRVTVVTLDPYRLARLGGISTSAATTAGHLAADTFAPMFLYDWLQCDERAQLVGPSSSPASSDFPTLAGAGSNNTLPMLATASTPLRIETDPILLEAAWLHHFQSRPERQRMWTECSLLVIDSIERLPVQVWLLMDKVARVARGCMHKPFGGLPILVLGTWSWMEHWGPAAHALVSAAAASTSTRAPPPPPPPPPPPRPASSMLNLLVPEPALATRPASLSAPFPSPFTTKPSFDGALTQEDRAALQHHPRLLLLFHPAFEHVFGESRFWVDAVCHDRLGNTQHSFCVDEQQDATGSSVWQQLYTESTMPLDLEARLRARALSTTAAKPFCGDAASSKRALTGAAARKASTGVHVHMFLKTVDAMQAARERLCTAAGDSSSSNGGSSTSDAAFIRLAAALTMINPATGTRTALSRLPNKEWLEYLPVRATLELCIGKSHVIVLRQEAQASGFPQLAGHVCRVIHVFTSLVQIQEWEKSRRAAAAAAAPAAAVPMSHHHPWLSQTFSLDQAWLLLEPCALPGQHFLLPRASWLFAPPGMTPRGSVLHMRQFPVVLADAVGIEQLPMSHPLVPSHGVFAHVAAGTHLQNQCSATARALVWVADVLEARLGVRGGVVLDGHFSGRMFFRAMHWVLYQRHLAQQSLAWCAVTDLRDHMTRAYESYVRIQATEAALSAQRNKRRRLAHPGAGAGFLLSAGSGAGLGVNPMLPTLAPLARPLLHSDVSLLSHHKLGAASSLMLPPPPSSSSLKNGGESFLSAAPMIPLSAAIQQQQQQQQQQDGVSPMVDQAVPQSVQQPLTSDNATPGGRLMSFFSRKRPTYFHFDAPLA